MKKNWQACARTLFPNLSPNSAEYLERKSIFVAGSYVTMREYQMAAQLPEQEGVRRLESYKMEIKLAVAATLFREGAGPIIEGGK